MQSKKHSTIEAITKSSAALVVVTLAQMLYFKLRLGLPAADAIQNSLEFSVIAFSLSVGVGYIIRRFFNKKTVNSLVT